MSDLITTDRAKYNLNNLGTSSAEDTTIAALISAVSTAIGQYCRREFAEAERDELYHGSGRPTLRLNQYPVTAVDRVAGSPTGVLRLENTDADNRRATVEVTDTGLTLTRVNAGTSSEDTSVTWASNATLADVVDAINALGNGWSASLVNDSGAWPSADLISPQGALSARGRAAELILHTEELSTFDVEADTGLLRRDRFGQVWVAGSNNYRVVYTAGYPAIPEDVQEACAQWVAELFWQTKGNPGTAPVHPPVGVRRLLEPWRRFAW